MVKKANSTTVNNYAEICFVDVALEAKSRQCSAFVLSMKVELFLKTAKTILQILCMTAPRADF